MSLGASRAFYAFEMDTAYRIDHETSSKCTELIDAGVKWLVRKEHLYLIALYSLLNLFKITSVRQHF